MKKWKEKEKADADAADKLDLIFYLSVNKYFFKHYRLKNCKMHPSRGIGDTPMHWCAGTHKNEERRKQRKTRN